MTGRFPARALAAIAGAAAMVLTAVAPAYATADTTPPVLHSVTVDGDGTFTAGEPIVVHADATDDAGIRFMSVRFVDSMGRQKDIPFDVASMTASITVDYGWANGPVDGKFVYIEDVNHNISWYFDDGRVSHLGTGWTSHDVDLTPLDVATYDTGEDNTPPVLDSIVREGAGVVTAGDTVTYDVDVPADAHGDPTMQLVLEDSSGKAHTFHQGATPGTAVGTIDGSWADGPVTLRQVQLYDSVFNMAAYDRDGTVYYSPPALGTGTHSFDFTLLGFEVVGGGGDTTPPELTSLTLREPGPFVEGDTVTFDWTAADPSDVAGFGLQDGDAAGKAHSVYTETGGSVSFTVDESWGIGRTHVDVVQLSDAAGNWVAYSGNGTINSNPPGSVTSSSIDFAALEFDVQGAPSVSMASTPPAYSSSRTATFAFSATDRDTPKE